MTLRDWLNSGWLCEHEATAAEITDLFSVVERDLRNAGVQGLSDDWRLAIAYNAAMQLATAALCGAGFRATRDSHHYRVIQSLSFTIGADKGTVRLLDAFRRKRNIAEYDRAGTVSQKEADEMIALAEHLRRDVEKWLRAEHPELL